MRTSALAASRIIAGIPAFVARVQSPARSSLDCHNAPMFPKATKMAIFQPYGYFDIFVPELTRELRTTVGSMIYRCR